MTMTVSDDESLLYYSHRFQAFQEKRGNRYAKKVSLLEQILLFTHKLSFTPGRPLCLSQGDRGLLGPEGSRGDKGEAGLKGEKVST